MPPRHPCGKDAAPAASPSASILATSKSAPRRSANPTVKYQVPPHHTGSAIVGHGVSLRQEFVSRSMRFVPHRILPRAHYRCGPERIVSRLTPGRPKWPE